MNAARLLALYEQVAEAAGAVPRLRRFVLDLAVRGKLVPQDAGDEPAKELLGRIAAEKARLVKAKKIRKPKALLPNDPELWPFTLPNGWTWARLDELSPRFLIDGDWIETKDQSEDGSIRLIQLADVGAGAFLDKSSRFITAETEVHLNCTRLEIGDVLIARLPNPIGRACIFPDIGQPAITAVDVAILRLDENVSAEYVVNAMNAPPMRDQIGAYGKGATHFRVSTGHLKIVLIPLPPLAEQHRIVAKVEALMALLDRLEAARTAREATRDRLTAASLARLTVPDTREAEPVKVGTGFASDNAATEDSFPTHAHFALATLPALTARPDQIKPLRQTILDLAVRGKLVEQDAGDEPASELLGRIAAEKARLVKAKAIRKPKPLPPIEDQPFGLPSNWRWVRIRDVTSDRGQRIPDGDFTYIDVTAINKEAGIVAVPKVLTKDVAPSRARKIAAKGDVLYSCVRPYLLNVAVLDQDFDPAPIASTAFALLNGHGLILPWYLWIALRSPFMVECVEENQRGQAYPAINDKDFSLLPFPLPPLAEQHRIVAKVEELMALLDRLEAALATRDTTRTRLLEALLVETLTPTANPATKAAE